MNNRKPIHHFILLMFLSQVLLWESGCIKEYSYEGSVTDTTTNDDPVIKPVIAFPYCSECIGQDIILPSRWSFKVDTTLLCGEITRAVISPERTAFTFFGPSDCSPDTGLIMTIYLDDPILNSDKTNITLNKVFFQYYHRGSTDVLLSKARTGFTIQIDRYDHSEGTAYGSFSGNSYTEKGDLVLIKEGKFDIKFQ